MKFLTLRFDCGLLIFREGFKICINSFGGMFEARIDFLVHREIRFGLSLVLFSEICTQAFQSREKFFQIFGLSQNLFVEGAIILFDSRGDIFCGVGKILRGELCLTGCLRGIFFTVSKRNKQSADIFVQTVEARFHSVNSFANRFDFRQILLSHSVE